MTPPDDDDGPPLKPLMGRGFWILMAFSLLLVVAGAAVAYFGGRA